MARLILKSPYLKPVQASHLSRYVKYIATREGVSMVDDSSGALPALKKQKKIISEITERHPESMQSPEYLMYEDTPDRKHADEFIVCAANMYDDLNSCRQQYVNYIATRPGVVKKAAHGLFTDDGVYVSLEKVAAEVAAHPGNVWTHIISLRREDAKRLGYDNVDDWMALLRSKRNMFAINMKISPENFRWYAAFHNDGSHPHVHMIAYSVDPREAYLTRRGIENIKKNLAEDIFRQDLMCIYREQTDRRDELRRTARSILDEIAEAAGNGGYSDPQIAQLLIELAGKLANTKAKKVYGYLPKETKALVNRIVDLLAEDERIAKIYELWYQQRCDIFRTYTDDMPPKAPLSECPEFKPVKNAVIKAALKLLQRPDSTIRLEKDSVYSQNLSEAMLRMIADLSRVFEQEIDYNDRALADLDSKEREKIEEKLAAHGLKHG